MKYWIIFTLIFLSFQANSQSQCFDVFNIYRTVQGQEYLLKLRHKFFYFDKTYNFKFEAELDRDGFIFIDVELTNSSRSIRSTQHGGLLFKEMIQHFGLKNINGIYDIWGKGTNLSQLNANLRNRMSVEDAAFNTWSGRQAALYGFTKIETYEFIKVQESEWGDIPYPINLRPFNVVFVRP